MLVRPLAGVICASLLYAAPGAPALADPLPTEQKFIYVDIQVVEVLAERDTFQVTYACRTYAAYPATTAGVQCGILDLETRFLPGTHSVVLRTERVPAAHFAIRYGGTGVFIDGTILTIDCATDDSLAPHKYAACGYAA